MRFRTVMLCQCFALCLAVDKTYDIPEDWVDPSDMATFDYGTKTNRRQGDDFLDLKSTPEEEQQQEEEQSLPSSTDSQEEIMPDNSPPTTTKSPSLTVPDAETKDRQEKTCDYPFMHRFVTVLQKRMETLGVPPTVEHYELHMHLNSREWLTLLEFTEECKSAAEVTHILESMVQSVHVHLDKGNNWKRKFEDLFHMSFEDCVKCGVSVLLVVSILTMEWLSRVSWSSQIIRLIILAFFVSLGMTYFHELKLAEAEYKSKAADSIPPECLGKKAEDLSYWQSIKSVYNDMFSVKKDPCAEYHANFLISPHLKVTPTKVVAVTLTKFAVEPMEHVGIAFSKAFKNIFAGLPVTLWIPAFVCVVLVILGFLLIIAVCFGYTFNFNLPFWAGLQMGPQQVIQHNPELERVLEDNRRHIDQLQATIRELRERPQVPALPAPVHSPSRGRGILGLFGLGGGDNNPTPKKHHSPPPYPAQHTQGSNLPYPDFESPRYPPDDNGSGAAETVSLNNLRRRNTIPREAPRTASESGGQELPYPAESPTKPRSSSTSQASSNLQGQRPIGFEHLLEENEDNCTGSRTAVPVRRSATATVSRPVEEFPVHASGDAGSTRPKGVQASPDKELHSARKLKATPDSFQKKESKNETLKVSNDGNQVETLPAEAGVTDGISHITDQDLHDWEEVTTEETSEHHCAGGKLDTMELEAIFEREAQEGFKSED